MFRLQLLLLIFTLGACASIQGNAPLEMPERYLGYWSPVSNTLAGVGIDIQPGVFYEKDDPDYYVDQGPDELDIRYYTNYKVIHFDDTQVYLITEEHVTKEWVEKSSEISYEEYVKKGYAEPDYAYIRLFIEPDDLFPDQHFLDTDGYYCGLTEKDWHLPLHIHRERILTKYCETRPNAEYDHAGSGVWNR